MAAEADIESRTDWPYGLTEGWTDVGGDHLTRPTSTSTGDPHGFIEAHRDQAGQWCGGMLYRRGRNPNGPEWDVLSEDPLTLSPSVLCRTCGEHGFIRDGQWVPA